jgi:hypothetical protein
MLCNKTFAWIRDADISESRDSVGVGYTNGPIYMAEKIIDNKTSIGASFMPNNIFSSKHKNIFDLSYNKQIAGGRDETYACSIYGGFLWMAQDIAVPVDEQNWVSLMIPEFGFNFRWQINKYFTTRVDLLWFYCPWQIELAYRLNENYDISIGFALRSFTVKYLF